VKCYAFNAAAGSKQPALSEAQCETLAAMRLPDFAIAPLGLGLLPHSPLLQPDLLRAMFDVGYFLPEPQYR
jgi:hypothetical protein